VRVTGLSHHTRASRTSRWLHVGCPLAAHSTPLLHLPSLQLLCSSSIACLPAPASTHPPAFDAHHLKPVRRQGSSFEGLVRQAATPIRLYLADPLSGTARLPLDGGRLPVRPRAGARDQFPPHGIVADRTGDFVLVLVSTAHFIHSSSSRYITVQGGTLYPGKAARRSLRHTGSLGIKQVLV
jgi:hypothetical protein